MGSDLLDTTTRFVKCLTAGDLAGCRALLHDDVVIDEAAGLPFGGIRRGVGGFNDLLTDIGRRYVMDLGDPVVTQAGDVALARFQGKVTSRRSGRSTVMPVLDLYSVTAGKVTRIDVFYKDAAAILSLEDSEPDAPEVQA